MTNLEIAKKLLKNRCCNAQAKQLDIDYRPKNTDQAFAIQSELIKLQGSPVVGWKCSLPINDLQFIAAPIFASDFFDGESVGDEIEVTLFSENSKARIEPEIAFKLGKTLAPKAGGYSETEIDNAIISAHMAVELIQDRYESNTNVSFYEKQADCFSNQGLYLGAEIEKEQAYQAADIAILIRQNNKKISVEGKHPNGFPQHPLHWLINFMTKRGVVFNQGDVIITGSYAGVVELMFNQKTVLEYKGIGKSTFTLIEK